MTNLVTFPGLGLSFEVNRVAFTIGGMNIYWYGVLIATGIVLAILFAFRHCAEFGIDGDSMTDVIVVGVVLMIPLRPVLENPVLVPAFDNVVPALFGALGLKYFSKSPKIAVVPVLFMTLLCVLVPSMISQTSILIIPSGALALAIGYVLFKKGKL